MQSGSGAEIPYDKYFYKQYIASLEKGATKSEKGAHRVVHSTYNAFEILKDAYEKSSMIDAIIQTSFSVSQLPCTSSSDFNELLNRISGPDFYMEYPTRALSLWIFSLDPSEFDEGGTCIHNIQPACPSANFLV